MLVEVLTKTKAEKRTKINSAKPCHVKYQIDAQLGSTVSRIATTLTLFLKSETAFLTDFDFTSRELALTNPVLEQRRFAPSSSVGHQANCF